MKKYGCLIGEIENINVLQSTKDEMLPHCSNLLHQLRKKDDSKLQLFNDICLEYVSMRSIDMKSLTLSDYIRTITDQTNKYLNFFWPPSNNPFIHQADFVSSVLPEMICLIFKKAIDDLDLDISLIVSAQKDLVIECIFAVSEGGRITFKNKKVDVSVSLPCSFIFNSDEFMLSIPLLAVEVKTNLDKNMISGIEHSVSELKKTFPECEYYVVSEVSDFDVKKVNYASSAINEIYICRKQKRATVRNNPTSRNNIDQALIEELANRLIDNIVKIKSNRRNLEQRMKSGKLVSS